MIKPDAVEDGHIGAILNDINAAGFRIVAMKYTKLSAEQAGKFYEVHQERPFYGELVSFMSRGTIASAHKMNVDAYRFNRHPFQRSGRRNIVPPILLVQLPKSQEREKKKSNQNSRAFRHLIHIFTTVA